jgi:hypothetical protein
MSLSADRLYEFDLNGYLVVEDAIPADLLADVNRAVDRMQEREAVWPLADAESADPKAQGGQAKIINIVHEDDAYLRVAMSPKVIAAVETLVVFPRLKSTWLSLNSYNRGISFHANHTPHDPVNAFYFQNRVCCSLLTVMYALNDVPEDGGALQVIPGSHKSNYPLPEDPAVLERLRIKLPLFSHDVNHGSKNTRNYVRRGLFTSFSPGSSAHTLGDNDLYDSLFHRSVEGGWQKYLLRRPRGDRDTYPQPKHPVEEDSDLGRLLPIPEVTLEHEKVPVVL